MACQADDNGPPPLSPSIQEGVQHQNNNTVISAGATQLSPIIIAQQPYNHFAAKASVTKKLGISILVFGILTVILGVIMLSGEIRYWASFIASGVWSGIFVIIAGSLCIGAGSNVNNTCVRVGALVMCIIGMLATFSSGILMFFGFAYGVERCTERCYSFRGQSRNIKEGTYLSFAVAMLNVIAFFLMLAASVYTARGCCRGCCAQGGCCYPGNTYQGATVMFAPQQAYSGPVMVSGSQAMYSPNNGYVPQPQYYPAQPQQYSQAAMSTSSGGHVTYGNDYDQQQRQEEQNVMPPSQDAPPAYSRHS